MFVNLAQAIFNGAAPAITPVQAMNAVLTQLTAEQLAYYADRVWEQPRVAARNVLPGGNAVQHQQQSFDIRGPLPLGNAPLPPPIGYWRHLIYAYMLESTNILAVFRQVVHEWVHGEKLPFPSQPTQVWLRTTEQLFFTTPQPPSIRSLMSDIRPDRGDIRCNAYFRLMGLDLPAGTRGGRPYVKADTANREFVKAWEQLLHEVWRAYINVTNLVGPNATDVLGLQELVREIREMLIARRNGGALSREEFDAVSLFSWFHLTVFGDTQVVVDLTAQSTSAALRLKKIADQVNVPIQTRTDSFIQLADDMADILEAIETGALAVQALYMNGNVLNSLTQSMLRVITHWSITTGRDVKGISMRTTMAQQAPAVQPPSAAIPLPQTARFQSVSRT